MSSSSSSDKEREILERQRRLAAQIQNVGKTGTKKPAPPSSSMKNGSSMSTSSASLNFQQSSNASRNSKGSINGKVIDLTTDSPNSDHRSGPTNIKRPTMKRSSALTATTSTATTGNKTSTLQILAAARAKAAGKEIASSNGAIQKPLTNHPITKSKQKESPKVQRKKIDPLAASANGGISSSLTLASLVQHVVATSEGTGDSGGGNINDTFSNNDNQSPYQPDDFWKNLREWDLLSQYYYETQIQTQQQQADKATTTSKNDEGGSEKPRSASLKQDHKSEKKALPDTFTSARQYIAAWAPLCMEECRSQLLQEMVNTTCTNPILVNVESTHPYRQQHQRSGRNNSTDQGRFDGHHSDWLDENDTAGYVKITQSKQESNNNNSNIAFFPNDVILLVQEPYRHIMRNISNGTQQPTNRNDVVDDAGISTTAFQGISLIGHSETTRRELDGLILKVSKRKWTKNGTKQMYLIKVGSNVTALREFTALCGMTTLPMSPYLLGHHLDKEEHRRKLSRNQPIEQLVHQMGGSEKLGDGFIRYACNKYNQSQLTAIAASAHEYGEGGFTLIKGPPGTGKTTTLVAILNSLHIRQFNQYYDKVRRIATQATGSREKALSMARSAKPRLLVCAPSNAAIDNIILKIMEDGFIDGQGRRYNPSMIRVGVGQSHQVRDVALSQKVDAIFAENMDAQQLQASIVGYRTELTHIARDIANVRRRAHAIETATPWPLSKDWEIRIDEESFEQVGKAFFVNHVEQITTYEIPPPPEPGETQFKPTSMPEYRAYVSRLVKLVESYFSTKTHLERCTIVMSSLDAGANQFEIRQTLESHVLNSVHMVMTTLGSSGNRTLEAADRFEVIVVDEAAQSVEPASLSALRLGSRHAVLVGDPQQLPATIFNVSGRHTKYDRSLFQRLEEAGQPVYMLNEQYRMHPKISHFPRHIFYGGALLDGPNVCQPDYGSPLRSILCQAIPTFSPLTILDLDSKEDRGGTSLSNLSEAKLAVFMYDQLKIHTRGLSASTKVAVITPYAQQCRLLRDLFSASLGPQYESLVEVNTVDAFQGREANIVIFSAVRAAGSRGIGFLSDVRRMNVALTRAKFFLFVIARCASVVVNPYWSDLIDHARVTNAVLRVPLTAAQPHNVSFGDISSWESENPNATEESIQHRQTAFNGISVAAHPPIDPRKRKRKLL